MEAEAREVLLRRRRSLSQGFVRLGPADPSARWGDYESAPPPPTEGVRRELADIDAALARIQDGRYGDCLRRATAWPAAASVSTPSSGAAPRGSPGPPGRGAIRRRRKFARASRVP